MTTAQHKRELARIRRRYTRVVRYGKTYCAYLQIDYQSFCVVDHATKRRANGYRDNLAIALERLLNKNENRRTDKTAGR